MFVTTILSAQSSETCYSIQVKSFHLKHNSSYDFHRKGYPSSCKLMKLSSMYAVRCGCFSNFNEAQYALDKLSDVYYDAIVVNTYRYRFGNNIEETQQYQTQQPQKKRYRNEYNSNSDSFYQRYNDIELDENREKKEDDYSQESSFDNDFEDEDDLSEYGYE